MLCGIHRCNTANKPNPLYNARKKTLLYQFRGLFDNICPVFKVVDAFP